MAYKWRPSKTQRREFAIRMTDPIEAQAYEARKAQRAENRRSKSKFDYQTAGGLYVPTKAQHDFAFNHIDLFTTNDERASANEVMCAYSCNEKVHHDHIHIVNEKIRSHSFN